MVVLFDSTIQHTGWQGGTFATGGFNDFISPQATGLVARSFYAEALNRQRTDVGLAFTSGGIFQPTGSFFFNQNISGPASGSTGAFAVTVNATTQLETYTRTLTSSGAIFVRVIVTDQATTPPPTSSPCIYGTQVKPSQIGDVILTPDLLTLMLTPLNMIWAAILFVPLQYTVLNTQSLCSQPPPPMPALSTDDIGGSITKIKQALDAVSWPYFCECKSGVPNPVPYPPPAVVVPPGWPAAPTFVCDPADICTTLELIRQELAGLRATTSSILQLDTLLQRYGLPFAYTPGALHFGLSGEGEFSIPRCVGLQVDVTSPPPAKILQGNPDYWWDQGWMSIGNDTGMLEEKRIARPTHLWQPRLMQEATRFRWSLNPGVVIGVRELYAER